MNRMSVEEGKGRGRIGRPPKRPTPGKRMSLGLKVTAEVKARLDKAASETGRTQSQEAELRLERSFEREDLVPQVLRLAYGDGPAELLMQVGAHLKRDPMCGSGAFVLAAHRWLRGNVRTKDDILAAGENLDDILAAGFIFVLEDSDKATTRPATARAPAKKLGKPHRKRSPGSE